MIYAYYRETLGNQWFDYAGLIIFYRRVEYNQTHDKTLQNKLFALCPTAQYEAAVWKHQNEVNIRRRYHESLGAETNNHKQTARALELNNRCLRFAAKIQGKP